MNMITAYVPTYTDTTEDKNSVMLGVEPNKSAVNHPSHYNVGGIETIDYIESLGMGKGFCIGNAIKYLSRAGHKVDELEDLKKAEWYIHRAISEIEKGDDRNTE